MFSNISSHIIICQRYEILNSVELDWQITKRFYPTCSNFWFLELLGMDDILICTLFKCSFSVDLFHQKYFCDIFLILPRSSDCLETSQFNYKRKPGATLQVRVFYDYYCLYILFHAVVISVGLYFTFWHITKNFGKHITLGIWQWGFVCMKPMCTFGLVISKTLWQ